MPPYPYGGQPMGNQPAGTQPYGYQPYGYQPYGDPGAPQWAQQPNYAHWGWRLLGYIIDALLLSLVAGLIANPFLGDYYQAFNRWQFDLEAAVRAGSTAIPWPWDYYGYLSGLMISALIGLAVAFIYHVAMLTTLGASLGKLAVGLRVVPATDLGAKKLPFATAAVRQLCFLLFNYILIFNVVNWLSPLWREKRQAFHDSAAKTVVLKVR